MMGFILPHGSQPLPYRNRRSTGSNAFLLRVFRGKGAEDGDRFLMHVIEKWQYVFRAVRELRSVAGIEAGLELNVLRVHIALDGGQMADDIGKAEFAFGVAPVKFFRRNAGNDFQRALADFFPVVVVPESNQFASAGSFHKAVYCNVLSICRNFPPLKTFR